MISLLVRHFMPENADNKTRRSIYGYVCGTVGVVLNILLFAVKLFAGIVSSSVSITADAFNNLTDALTSVISLFGFILSGQRADNDHPFGHGRIEYIAGTFISSAVIFVGIELLRSSLGKIFNPEKIVFDSTVMTVLIASVLVKLYMAYYNSASGRKINSSALKAVAADSFSDSIATLAILLSAVFTHFTGVNIDGYAGAAVSVLIIKTGISSVITAATPLLGGVPDREFVRRVEEIVRENPETVGIHDLVVHDYGPDKRFVSLHMEVDGRGEMFTLHDAVDLTERRICDELGCEAVIHMDPIDVENPEMREIYAFLSEECSRISEGANVHDLRIVPGPTHTNVIFDLILPPDIFGRKDEICLALEKRVQDYNKSYYAVITAETSYI